MERSALFYYDGLYVSCSWKSYLSCSSYCSVVSLGGAESPLGCAVLALGSDNDPRVPAEETQEWARYTSGPFDHRVFAGGHFFLKTSHADVTAYIASIALTGPPRTASTGLIMYDPNADK